MQEGLQGWTDGVVHLGLSLGVAQPLLGLPLELRIVQVDGKHPDHALADVFRGQIQVLGGKAGIVQERAHGLDDGAAEALLVRSPLGGGDAVHVAAQGLVMRLGPLQGAFDAHAIFALKIEGLGHGGRLAPIGDDLGEEVGDPPFVL